ncbi:MAG: hypothetical protein KAW41_01390 [Candidatus Diapherotrites archaeon]|nr:hypothetical protein [Candidatus Diapherotrites archaeon]
MANEAPLRQFDDATEAMEKKIAKMKEKGYLPKYLDKLKDKRGELVYALEHENEEKAAEIIDLAISFGKEVNRMRVTKPKRFGFLSRIVPKPTKKIVSSPKKEKEAVTRQVVETASVYDDEFRSLAEELAKREVELEGLKGAYASLSAEMGEMRRKMEAKQAKDVKELAAQIKEVKGGMDSVHSTMSKEFASNKAAYRDFGLELVSVAIKVSELEELIERGDTVTEMDVLELHNSVALLARRLMLTEAKQKKNRLALIEKMKTNQKKILKALQGKADTQKVVKAIKQYVSELRHELDEQDSKIAAEMHVEIKSSYYTLGQKLKKIEADIGKAKSKKDLEAVQKKVAGLTRHIEDVREGELSLEREMEQQHLSDRALMQRIDSISDRVRKGGEMGQLAIADLYRSIEALELQIRISSGDARKVKTMVKSLGSIKKDLSKIEEEAGGTYPAKKRVVKKGKKKAVKKTKKKKKAAKKKKLFGLLGG